MAKRFIMTKAIVIILSIVIVTFHTQATFAADSNCKPLYGGGVTKEQSCDGKKIIAPAVTRKAPVKATPTPIKSGPTPLKAKPSPTPTKQSGTTKGGLTVISPTPQKTTPSTGPEMLGLIALAPAAALGFYLRKKG